MNSWTNFRQVQRETLERIALFGCHDWPVIGRLVRKDITQFLKAQEEGRGSGKERETI